MRGRMASVLAAVARPLRSGVCSIARDVDGKPIMVDKPSLGDRIGLVYDSNTRPDCSFMLDWRWRG